MFLCSKQLGCPVNLPLTTQLHNYVLANKWAFRDAGSADYIIVVSCSILLEYREEMVALVRYLARRHPRQQIIVTGCFVKEDMVRAPNVTYIPLAQTRRFDALLHPAVPLRAVPARSTPEDDAQVQALGDAKAVFDRPYQVLVGKGCLSNCAYCIEKILFPKAQSVPLAEVVSACQEGVRKGYTNFLIGGVDISSYGRDLGLDVRDLFRALFTRVFTGGCGLSVGFKALEPAGFIAHFADLKRYFRTGRISWIYMPIESGSDRVLRSMRRRYRVRDFMRVVRELRCLAPRLRIETDFVFCYPTETRQDFEASLRLLRHFDHFNLVVFGRHRGTAAFAMKDAFSPAEKARRCRIIREIASRQRPCHRPECRSRAMPRLPAASGASSFAVLSQKLAARPAR